METVESPLMASVSKLYPENGSLAHTSDFTSLKYLVTYPLPSLNYPAAVLAWLQVDTSGACAAVVHDGSFYSFSFATP